jgi:hypothetical protein
MTHRAGILIALAGALVLVGAFALALHYFPTTAPAPPVLDCQGACSGMVTLVGVGGGGAPYAVRCYPTEMAALESLPSFTRGTRIIGANPVASHDTVDLIVQFATSIKSITMRRVQNCGWILTPVSK